MKNLKIVKFLLLWSMLSATAWAQSELKTIIAIQQSQLLNQQKMIQEQHRQLVSLRNELLDVKQNLIATLQERTTQTENRIQQIETVVIPEFREQLNLTSGGANQRLEKLEKDIQLNYLRKENYEKSLHIICRFIANGVRVDIENCSSEEVRRRINRGETYEGNLAFARPDMVCTSPAVPTFFGAKNCIIINFPNPIK